MRNNIMSHLILNFYFAMRIVSLERDSATAAAAVAVVSCLEWRVLYHSMQIVTIECKWNNRCLFLDLLIFIA